MPMQPSPILLTGGPFMPSRTISILPQTQASRDLSQERTCSSVTLACSSRRVRSARPAVALQCRKVTDELGDRGQSGFGLLAMRRVPRGGKDGSVNRAVTLLLRNLDLAHRSV